MKPFTVLAALASGRWHADSPIPTSPGYFRVGRLLVTDPLNRGTITLLQALQKSSQVAIAKVALDLDQRAVFDVLSRIGMGEYIGIGLPGEALGTLTDQGLKNPVVRTTLAYGYGLALSPLHLTQGYLTLASGGLRMPLTILRRHEIPASERVIEESLAREVVTMLESVTAREGTAPGARVPGYRIGHLAQGRRGRLRRQAPRCTVRRDCAGDRSAVRDGCGDQRTQGPAGWWRGCVRAGVWPGCGPRVAAARRAAGRGPHDMSMRLHDLLADQPGIPEVAIRHLVLDSRQVEPGDLFVALRGERHDGHDHVVDALGRGAVAVLAERPVTGASVPIVVVPALRERLGALAARYYGDPGDGLYCVGVTGTNGKTSIAHYLADLATRVGLPAGYIGTIGWGLIGALGSADLTTPDPITVQRQLAALRDQSCRWAVLEVSSHALTQERVRSVPFRAAVFSNLSRDHLDYHVDLDAYGAAKARLFAWPGLELAVINRDDAFGRQLVGQLAAGVRSLGFGRGDESVSRSEDVSWSGLAFDATGATGTWHTPWGTAPLRLPVHAEFSVANAAAALAVLGAAGVPLEQLAAAAATLAQVPGRMEYFRAPGRAAVVVDFAHTPDALAQVLVTLRPRTVGRLVCVFGCGGDRDKGKRPLMAAAADRVADVLWLTSDNPRSEPADAIIADMRAGLSGHACAHEEPDRRVAIERAIERAGPDDLVLVAGKGHEAYQEIAGVRRPFSDRQLVAELLAEVV